MCLHQHLYDIKDPPILLYWIEFYLVLGIYFQNVPEIFYEIMNPCINEGLVAILDWKLKPPVLSGTDITWCQSALINDCIYHNMYRVKYPALMDMDEFVIPQYKITLQLPICFQH